MLVLIMGCSATRTPPPTPRIVESVADAPKEYRWAAPSWLPGTRLTYDVIEHVEILGRRIESTISRHVHQLEAVEMAGRDLIRVRFEQNGQGDVEIF